MGHTRAPVAACAQRAGLLTRSKPIFQQSLFVLIALVIYETLLWAIDGYSGRPMNSPARWAHAATGALVWPILAGLLGRTHLPSLLPMTLVHVLEDVGDLYLLYRRAGR